MGNAAGRNFSPVQVKQIQNIQLQRVLAEAPTDTNAVSTIQSQTLWADKPCVVFVVRRPGCPLCREHALDLCAQSHEFNKMGVKLVGVVHEMLGADEFAKEYFNAGELYFDEKKAFFESLGSRWLGFQGLLYPSVHSNAKRAKAKNVEGNWAGEGRLLGGLLVVGAGGSTIVFEHREKVFGDHAKMEDVLTACRTATGTEAPTPFKQSVQMTQNEHRAPAVCK